VVQSWRLEGVEAPEEPGANDGGVLAVAVGLAAAVVLAAAVGVAAEVGPAAEVAGLPERAEGRLKGNGRGGDVQDPAGSTPPKRRWRLW
jgi:hypothetical protein